MLETTQKARGFKVKCIDHPNKEAVALIDFDKYQAKMGVCIECWNKHRKVCNLFIEKKEGLK